jgi:hypothetical protein
MGGGRGFLGGGNFPHWEVSPAVLFQHLNIVPKPIGRGVEQGSPQPAIPTVPGPISTMVHDYEPGEVGVDYPHLNFGWLVWHGFS